MFLKWLRLGKSGIRCFRRTMWPRTDQHASRKSSPVLSNLRRGKLKYTSQGSSASNPSTSQELIDYGRLRIPNRMIFQSKTLYCRFLQFPCKKMHYYPNNGEKGRVLSNKKELLQIFFTKWNDFYFSIPKLSIVDLLSEILSRKLSPLVFLPICWNLNFIFFLFHCKAWKYNVLWSL